MKVIMDSVIRIKEAPQDVLKIIKADLTMTNPKYILKKRLGLPTWNEPEQIKLLSECTNGEYQVPRGYYARLYGISGKVFLTDNRIRLDKVAFPSKPSLRDYQSPALQRAYNWQQGIIIMPCGAGKTETGLGIVAELQQPTLWITHTMDLLNQSMERAKSRCGLEGNQIGCIQGNNFTIGTHITFATVQTLSRRDLKNLKDAFGCIIIDECHLTFKDNAKARLFESVISQFNAFYRFGLTASEHRSDGLVETMFHVIGPKIYEVKQGILNDLGNVVVPRVEFIDTNFWYEEEPEDEGKKKLLNTRKMIGEMKDTPSRNDLIVSYLESCTNKDYVIVLGDSLEHLEALQARVNSNDTPAAFVCGDTPKKTREKIMEDMRNGKYTYLFATYQLAKLGLDIPILNKLFLVTPKKDKTSIQQAVGRIMRKSEGKSLPIVYDFYDCNVRCCVGWAKERTKVYKTLGCQITGGPKIRGI